MLKHVKAVLNKLKAADSRKAEGQSDTVAYAVAVLLVEVMHADHHLDENETRQIQELLVAQFHLEEAAAHVLLEQAITEVKGVVSLHQYTSCINSQLSYPEKQALLANLWTVVYADGRVDKYEEHLVRRIADLLHVAHRDFIKAKHQAQGTEGT